MTRSAMDEDEAARWAIRLDAAPLLPFEEKELEAWLSADQRRRGALLRAEAVLAYLDRGRALSDQVEDRASFASVLDRRRFLMAGSVATLAAASVGTVIFTRPVPVNIQTAIGEMRRVPLSDGSVASVNTDSRLAVLMHDHRRDVKLEAGEAWFQVAHDKTRPFVVEAGEIRVQAVGTAFSVRRLDGGADVLVTEGVVETWIEGHEDKRTRIVADQRAFVSAAMPKAEVVEAPRNIDRTLAWRTGELALNGESLQYAVDELNRYNVRKLVIDDPKLAREPLVGFFRTDQPENFGRTVAGLVGAQVEVTGDMIRLSRRRS